MTNCTLRPNGVETRKEYWKHPANIELGKFGMHGFSEDSPRTSILWFDLNVVDFYTEWKGKLIVKWPPLDRNWHRWAHKPDNEMVIHAILEDSLFDAAMPNWEEINLTWDELQVLTKRWRSTLNEWRAIYYIYDTSIGKGYVGSANGDTNLFGRWTNYAAKGHGGNVRLRDRDPQHFRFTILQHVSPDMEPGEIIRLEAAWKERLHSRHPSGLNDN